MTEQLRSKRSRWLAIAGFSFVTAAAIVVVNRSQHKIVRSDEDLIGLLPMNDATVFFANVSSLRQQGYLRLLEGTKPRQESEYRQFVRETNFDYTKDLNAVAGAEGDHELFFALRGNFHWANIRAYAIAQGGHCDGGLCQIATSTPGRMTSMRSIQSDVIGLAIGKDGDAAERIGGSAQKAVIPLPAPVWVRPSRQLLADSGQLPPMLRVFAAALEPADSTVLSLQPTETDGGAFAIAIEAIFRNRPAAEAARTQLMLDTDSLKLALAREHRKPDPADLSWLLTSGSFQVTQQRLLGQWTVRNELLATLQ